MPIFTRRALTATVSLALAAGGLAGPGAAEAANPSFAATVAASPAAAVPADSAVGGTITRSEVIQRAQYWSDHSPGPYDQTAFSPDPTHSRNYRRDCSGVVDMAWHLNSDPNTHGLAATSTIFARSSTGTLAHWYYSGGWHYEDLAGDLAGTPSAYLYQVYDQLSVFGRTSDGYLHQWSYTPTGCWKDADVAHTVVSAIAGDPASYTYPVWEQQHIVARTTSGQLLNLVWDPGNGRSTGLLGSDIASTPTIYVYTPWGQQVVARTTDGKQHILARTGDTSFIHITWDGSRGWYHETLSES